MLVYCRNCGHPINLDEHIDLYSSDLICPHCGQPIMSGGNFCYNCGKPTFPSDIRCINCGAVLKNISKKWRTTVILALLGGWLGLHRFYTHHYVSGVLQFLSFGGLGIWTIIDIVRLFTGDFRDSSGVPILPPYFKNKKTFKTRQL